MDPTTIALIILAITGLIYSFKRNKDKTKKSMKIAKARFIETGTEIISILALIGLFFALVPESTIQSLLGGSNALLSALYGAGIGTVTIIPAFVAFPLSASLVQKGAHLIAVASFITTLTMVGFATAPIEIEHFGKKFTLIRNALSFILAIIIAIGMVIIL